MNAIITSLLDVLAILLVAAGIALLLWPYSPGAGVISAGIAVFAFSLFASRPAKPRPEAGA